MPAVGATIRGVLGRPLAWSLFVLGAALTHAACGGEDSGLHPGTAPTSTATATGTATPGVTTGTGTSGVVTPPIASGGTGPVPPVDTTASDYDLAACPAGNLAACDKHAADVVAAVDALVQVESTNDVRSVGAGIDALTAPDAEIVVEGLRIVGPYPKAPGVSTAVLPLMLDRRPVVRDLAVQILVNTPDGAPLARQYQAGHKGSIEGVQADTHDPTRPPATWGFPALAAAVPFPPGDGPMSLGFASTTSIDAVASFYGQQPGAKRMSAAEFMLARQKASAATNPAALRQQMQQLEQQMVQSAKAGKPPDPALLQQLQALSQRMQNASGAGTDGTPYPPNDRLTNAQYVVLTSSGDSLTRWVTVYTEPTVSRTIAILAWAASAGLPPMPAPTALRPRAGR